MAGRFSPKRRVSVKTKDRPCALIVIDMQNDFVLPDAPARVAGANATIPRLAEALQAFRKMGWPVLHVFREYREDGSDIEITRLRGFLERQRYCVPGTKGCEIVDQLKPQPGEYCIVKKRFSAFMRTELDWMLRRLGIDHIVVGGTQYPNCIRTTVFDGIAYGYRVTVLTDACSAQTQEISESNVRDIANIGVECVTVTDFLSNISKYYNQSVQVRKVKVISPRS
jgi:nicotinamidase-related amidase